MLTEAGETEMTVPACLWRRASLRSALLLVLLLPLGGCYYLQAAAGQAEVLSSREPIDAVIADEATSPALKARLTLVREARNFAVAALGLPDNETYRSYAALGRPYVAWNVFANEFDDGSFEWGQIVHGRGGYAAYVVQDTKYGTSMTNVQGAQFSLDADDCVGGASYRIGDNTWDFTGDADGRMLQFNKARWGGYRAQGGVTRRRGDTRRLVNGWTWLECFADRIRSEGLVRR